MITLEGSYFDGRQPIAMLAKMDFMDPEVVLTTGLLSERFATCYLRVSPRVGSTDRFIALPDGGQFLCADHPVLDSLPQESPSEGAVAWLELRWGVAVAGVVIMICALMVAYFVALPAAAERIAARIPMENERSLGRQALSWLDQNGWFKPTNLDSETLKTITGGFNGLCSDLRFKKYYGLEFRSSTVFGPNALALPGGIIVITDDMVNVAQSTEELLAILAHEIGHVELRHSMRSVLQNSIVAATAAAVTSDAASLSIAVTAFPVILAQTKYSREFEAAADDYSFQLLKRKGYHPSAFASIMERLAEKEEGETSAYAYVSSHPVTAERVRRARDAAQSNR